MKRHIISFILGAVLATATGAYAITKITPGMLASPFGFSSGHRLLVGGGTVAQPFGNSGETPPFQVLTTSGSAVYSAGLGNFESNGSGPRLRFAHSRSGSVGSFTVLNDADELGSIAFSGSDGTNFAFGAGIFANVDGTPGADDMPSRVTMLTAADGTQVGSERMRWDSKGNVTVGTAALATTATDGFLYVPTTAGVPTGVPTTYAGRAPIVIDTTNNRLYFYSTGAWRNAGP